MDGDDPWYWSVHRVLRFFREDAGRYGEDKNHFALPDLDTFERALIENDITGEELLNSLDLVILKTYCGIKSLRVSLSIIHCITKLQLESARYQQSHRGVQLLPAVGENIREGEVRLEDGRGRKRRRLALPLPDSVETSSPHVLSHNSTHLSPHRMPVDELIYGSTRLGEELQEIQTSEHTVWFLDESETDFSFIAGARAPGSIDYVHSQIRYMLCDQTSVELKRRGRLATAIHPYRESLLPQKAVRSATVFQTDSEGNTVAIRENAAYLKSTAFLESGIDYNDSSSRGSSDNNWDWLIEKYGGEHESPLLSLEQLTDIHDVSDKDDEEDSNCGSEAEEEDENGMHLDRVAAFVESTISKFVDDWREKLPILEKSKAWSTWKKTRQSRTVREALIAGATQFIRSLDVRLEKLKKGFCEDAWSSQQALAAICEILRPTIDERELQKWKINVWQRKAEPEHVVQHGRASRKGEQHAATSANTISVDLSDRFSVSPAPGKSSVQDTADEDRFHTPTSSPQPLFLSMDTSNDFDVVDVSKAEAELHTRDCDDAQTEEQISEPPKAKDDLDYADSEGKDTETSPSPPSMKEFCSQFSQRRSKSKASTKMAHDPTAMIDLTALSTDDDTPLKHSRVRHPSRSTRPSTESPPPDKRRGRKRKATRRSPSPSTVAKKHHAAVSDVYTSDPLSATSDEIRLWKLSELRNREDRQRILIKLLCEAGSQQREDIHRISKEYSGPGELCEYLLQALGDAYGNASELLEEEGAMETCARIALAWIDPSTLDQKLVHTKWDDFLHAQASDDTFQRYLDAALSRTKLFRDSHKSSGPVDISTAKDVIVVSSDHDAAQRTPRTNRKSVKQSQATITVQGRALARQSEWNAQRHALSSPNGSQPYATGVDLAENGEISEIVINPVKTEKDKFVYIPKRIAEHMKDHQIVGVQFMWRELTADAEDDDASQGCILAHTMGLGKTMQSIALLCTLDQASRSPDPDVQSQLPSHLRMNCERSLRVLILCPPTIVQNWRRELHQWAGNQFRHIYTIESGRTETQIDALESWYRFGGILLLGYQMFRQRLARPKNVQNPGDLSTRFEEILLRGPDIVIADEAHNLKNREASVSGAADRIRTRSRIGLTGTPMSNDVPEIYALVSWVAPGYLGEPRLFSGLYTKPIKDGTYEDSTPQEVRRSLVKLTALRKIIDPKVNRANIEVLRGSLKPKVEFVITLPLTDVQTVAYSHYVTTQMAEAGAGEKVSQVKIFAWLAILTLLTNHPLAFKMKLLDVLRRSKESNTRFVNSFREPNLSAAENDSVQLMHDDGCMTPVNDGDRQELDASVDNAIHELPEHIVHQITSHIDDDMNPSLSAKMTLLLSIIDLAKQNNDSLLVFTGSIPTLDYVDKLLDARGISHGRIDGQVPVQKRGQIIEKFQTGENDVMIISTRAGGVGLNIQRANRVVLLDFGFNPANEEQAIGRAYRLGQTKPVFVYRFVTGGTFETNIYNKQLFKTSLTSRVVDKKNPRRIAERNTKDWLYIPRPIQQEDIKHEMGKDPMVLDRIITGNNLSGSLIRALQTMETLQEESTDAPLTAEERKLVDEEIAADRNRTKLSRSGRAVVGLSQANTETQAIGREPRIVRFPLPQTNLPSITAGHAHPGVDGREYERAPTLAAAESSMNGLQRQFSSNQAYVTHGLPTAPSGPSVRYRQGHM